MDIKLVGFAVVGVVAVSAAGVAMFAGGGKDEPTPQFVPTPDPEPVAPVTRQPRAPESSFQEPQGRSMDDRFADWESRIAQFDKDGDGTLSDEERRAMMEQMRAEWRARMDKNGDGEVDADERLDAMLESGRGRRLAERFDADGDGTLSDAERQALKDSMAQREAEREQRRIDRYDQDGDGVLSPEEEAAAREAEQRQREDRFRQFADEFDQDGDGDLNADERSDAWATMRDRREIDAFVRRYDSNGDGKIDTTDFNAFLALYQSGSSRADVNNDGSVDALDVTAFRDLMGRAADRP